MQDVSSIELDFIAKDCAELIQLVLAIRNRPEDGAIALGLSPYIALFAEESYDYLSSPARQKTGMSLTSPLFETYPTVITKLRARVKFFDDSHGGLEGLIDTLALAHRKSSDWFLHPHRGLFGWLKRRLQPDLGIFYYGEHVICTTHTALLTLGQTYDHLSTLGPADMKNIGGFAYDFSVAAGDYLGQLASYFQARGYTFDDIPSIDYSELVLPISHNDHFGYLVYSLINDRLELSRSELSVVVLFLVAQVNFIDLILTRILTPTSRFLFRVKFMTAYHATRALQELERQNQQSPVNPLVRLISDVLSEPDSEFLLGARQVRNILAHYELRGAARFITTKSDPLEEVLLGLCQRRVEDVAAIAQRQLSRISNGFVEIISKSSLRKCRALLGDHS